MPPKQKPQTFDASAPPLVEETLLKKRKSLEELAHWRSVNLKQQVTRRRVVRGEDVKIKRPEQFVREFRINEGSSNKVKRKKRETGRRTILGGAAKGTEKKVGVVVRIHEGRHSSKMIKQDLKKMGLSKKYDATFTRLDEAALRKMKPLDEYLAYGPVTQKMTDELLHRRAYTDLEGARRPLSDNLTIEKAFGDKGILCLKDLSHEIYSVGAHFNEALSVLKTFKLAAPVGQYEKKILNVHDEIEEKGGLLSNHEMDEFLSRIV